VFDGAILTPMYLPRHDVFNKALGDTYTIECWFKPFKAEGE